MAGLINQAYQIHILHGIDGVDPIDDNVDVEVRFGSGEKYAATFFTLLNLQRLFEKNSRTGECKDGLYLWASDMISHLLSEGEFKSALSLLDEEADLGSEP